MAGKEKSVRWVVGMGALVVAYGGWAFLAAEFYRNDPNSRIVGPDFGAIP